MLALYIHWPFCLSKCPYCDFNSFPTPPNNQKIWVNAYERELVHYAERFPKRTIRSVFFGGGTPSLMTPQTLETIMDRIAALWPIADDIEVSLEANPTSVEAKKFDAFCHAGVNRLSLGVQALHDDALAFLGRHHNADETKAAMTLAAKTFPRFSFDLMYAYRGQTVAMWERDLRDVLTIAGDHLSLYQLTIEPRTNFFKRTKNGETLTLPEDDSLALFDKTQDTLANAGMPAYEVSNHARPKGECRHNLVYWHYEDYLGIGPGAHSRIGIADKNIRALENIAAPALWRESIEHNGSGITDDTMLSEDDGMHEALLMGLRLTEGIDMAAWDKKFSIPLLSFLSPQRVNALKDEGFLVLENKTHLRTTDAGRLRLNALLAFLS